MLEPRENVTVSGGEDLEFVRLALSPDGSTLVGCLGGDSRTCLVYDSEDLSSGPSATVDNAHYNSESGLAIIAMNDSFYLGSEGAFEGGNDNIFLAQYNYTSDTVRTSGERRYRVETADFVRHFYGGIARNDYVYYFVADQDPNAIRVLRVCDCARATCTSEFAALYEQELSCGGSTSPTTRVCGVHLLESFAGLAGPLVVVTQCDDGNTRNRACAFLLSDIDGDMDAYFNECKAGTRSGFQLPWDVSRPCSLFRVSFTALYLILILLINFLSLAKFSL